MPIDQTSNLNQQAVEALNAGQPQRAITLLQAVCEGAGADPHPQHWFLLGVALGMTGNIPAAEQAFRETLRLNPRHLQALANLGRALAEQEKFEEAADTMKQVLAINPRHRPARIGFINALMQLQRYAEAEECCNLLVKSDQRDAEALTLLGKLHKLKGEFVAALARFDQALSVDPGLVSAHMNKGLVLRAMGNDHAAIESFSQASRLAPDNPAVWFIKGMTHIATNALEQAAEDLEEAFRLNPRDVAAGGQLASVYRHLRRIPESVEVSRRILAVDPDNVRAKFYLQAFGNQEGDQAVQRIPREVAESTYSQADVGKNFEASLRAGLEYKAPDVLNDAVRALCGQRESGLDILEIGCGTGLCGSRFADIARMLVGTDLSTRMLDVAREKNAYTDLYVADLIDVLSENTSAFDLVIAMDVLCYFGDLTDIFRKCHDTLRANGVFALSVEKPDNDELWLLHPYGHFVHSLRHLQQAASSTGFEELFVKEMVLRREALEPRIGYVCLYRRK
jgi:predicted TPR repeat methyltransferase